MCVIRPDHISEEKWNTFSDEERRVENEAQIENEAQKVLSGPCREFLCHDTMLIRDCIDRNVMSEADIVNFPHPELWSARQCQDWCVKNGIDFRSECKEYDRTCLTLWLADVIQYGDSEIGTEVLRRILLSRLDEAEEHGNTIWRSVVKASTPDIYEWWSIEEELALDLIELGRFVLKNKYGHWWGRECTGMGILMDGTLQAVARKRLRQQSGV